jgi:hypothetical protein
MAVPDIGRPELAADAPVLLNETATGRAVLRFEAPAAGWVTFNLTAPPGEQPWTYQAETRIVAGNGTERTGTLTRTLEPGASERRFVAVPEGTALVEVALEWDDQLIQFGDPLLLKLVQRWLPAGDYMMHPTLFAGWVGLLVTGINLLPVGQLDGGHVARAVFGDRNRYVATGAAILLVLLAFLFSSWLLMALFVLLMGIQHPPPLNDRTRLDRKRMVLAVVVLAVFALCFVPVPIQ